MNLENQTALITGSSGGIGEDFAVAFAKRKANLVLVARREDKLAQLRTRLLEQHPGLTIDIITADLSVPGSATELAAKVGTLGRTIDILINNAGVGVHGDFITQGVEKNSVSVAPGHSANTRTPVDFVSCHSASVKDNTNALVAP